MNYHSGRLSAGSIFAIVFSALFIFGGIFASCAMENERAAHPTPQVTRIVSEGVVLGDVVYPGNCWVENTNPFPVRIRRVEADGYGIGEVTKEIFVLQPKERKILQYFSGGLYVYTMSGNNIAFLKRKS